MVQPEFKASSILLYDLNCYRDIETIALKRGKDHIYQERLLKEDAIYDGVERLAVMLTWWEQYLGA